VRVKISKLELLSDAEMIELSKQLKVDSSQVKVGLDYHDIGISVACSAGTYIRTLAQDIGRKLQTGAHLSSLERTRAGKFRIEDSITLEELQEIASDGKLNDVFVSMNDCVAHLPERKLTEEELIDVKHGRKIALRGIPSQTDFLRLTSNNHLVAIGSADIGENAIKSRIVFAE